MKTNKVTGLFYFLNAGFTFELLRHEPFNIKNNVLPSDRRQTYFFVVPVCVKILKDCPECVVLLSLHQ